jgi:hypothetical protein
LGGEEGVVGPTERGRRRRSFGRRRRSSGSDREGKVKEEFWEEKKE